MSPNPKELYEFSDFRLDAAERILTLGGERVAIPDKTFESLCALIRRGGELVTKDELMSEVWGETVVEENNLDKKISALRKILGERAGGEKFIETVRGYGYRFVVQVRRVEVESKSAARLENSQIESAKRSRNHSYTIERRGNVIAIADWQIEAQTEAATEAEKDFGEILPLIERCPTTSIIGREKEISEIKNLLRRDETRLVTLTGAGGAGKTTLARRIAADLIEDFPDGVFFVELSAIVDPELVPLALAQALGVREIGDKAVFETLKSYLRDKRTLLVIDNFEQVIDAAPQLAKLTDAEKLKILVTSRTILRLTAEREFIVPPLLLPPTDGTAQISPAEMCRYEAVKLFVERAQNARSNFILSNENAPIVAEICRRLEGLPLAIELAAARVKTLSPSAILSKLENRLRLLTGGARDLPARQQTMRDTVAWSYNLLSDDEKILFRRLAVFAGGFMLEAAEAICADDEPGENQRPKTADPIKILDLITSLIDKSLLIVDERFDLTRRFRMLEIVREYALDVLAASGEGEAMRRSHAAFFLALGEEAEPQLDNAESIKWLVRLEDEHDNLRSALQWSFENNVETATRLAAALRFFWMFHSHLTEGRRWLEAALERADNNLAVRFKLLNGLGVSLRNLGDYKMSRKTFEQALAEGEESGLSRGIALSHRGLGLAAMRQGDFESARKAFEEAISISRDLNDKSEIAHALGCMGNLAIAVGDYTAGRPFFEESKTIFRQLGNKEAASAMLHSLGIVAHYTGDYQAAYSHFAEALTTAQELGDKITISYSLEGFAGLIAEGGKAELAARLSGAAKYLRESIGYVLEPIDRRFRDTYLSKLRAALSETEFDAAYEQGRKLKLEEAIALALSETDSSEANFKTTKIAN